MTQFFFYSKIPLRILSFYFRWANICIYCAFFQASRENDAKPIYNKHFNLHEYCVYLVIICFFLFRKLIEEYTIIHVYT